MSSPWTWAGGDALMLQHAKSSDVCLLGPTQPPWALAAGFLNGHFDPFGIMADKLHWLHTKHCKT